MKSRRALLAVLLTCACSAPPPPAASPAPSARPSPAAAAIAPVPATPAPSAGPIVAPPAPAPAPPADPDSDAAIDAALARREAASSTITSELLGGLRPWMSTKDAIAALGAPRVRGKVESEGELTGGFMMTWQWKGVTAVLSAGTRTGPFTIKRISLVPPAGARSQRGIGLGSTRAEVVTAYGDLLEASGDAYDLGLDHAGARIELAGDRVTDFTVGFYDN